MNFGLIKPIVFSTVVFCSCSADNEKQLDELPIINLTPQQDTSTVVNRFIYHLDDLIDPSISYIQDYVHVEYPCGDVPANTGVCSDVVVRAFKNIDICLQQEVHEYRKAKGLSLERSIDHRRVRNLGPYFASLGWELDYNSVEDFSFKPGDIIWWKLGGRTDHIGIVMPNGMVLHNIGNGQVVDVHPHSYQIHKIYRIKE